MNCPKILFRTLFVFILLVGLVGGILILNLASVHAAPYNLASLGYIVISEFRFHGSGGTSDEFVENFNRSGGIIDLNGWKVKGANNSGATSVRFTFVTNVLLSPG
ncbi:MAG: lamin tail domain-containing protein [Anaerolineales bacterium]